MAGHRALDGRSYPRAMNAFAAIIMKGQEMPCRQRRGDARIVP